VAGSASLAAGVWRYIEAGTATARTRRGSCLDWVYIHTHVRISTTWLPALPGVL